MSLVTVEPASPTGLGWVSSQSRTMCVPGARETVQARISAASGGHTMISPLRGLGDGFETVPKWAWWAGGGLLVGLLGGALVLKLKRKR